MALVTHYNGNVTNYSSYVVPITVTGSCPPLRQCRAYYTGCVTSSTRTLLMSHITLAKSPITPVVPITNTDNGAHHYGNVVPITLFLSCPPHCSGHPYNENIPNVSHYIGNVTHYTGYVTQHVIYVTPIAPAMSCPLHRLCYSLHQSCRHYTVHVIPTTSTMSPTTPAMSSLHGSCHTRSISLQVHTACCCPLRPTAFASV